MKDQDKTKKQLENELIEIRKKVAEFEKSKSERKRMEESLRESEEWFRSMFDGSRDAVFITGENTRFAAVNQAAVDLTGYSKNELTKMTIPDLHDQADLQAFKTFFNRIMAGEAVTSEAKIRRKDGTKVDTEFSNTRIEIRGFPYMHTVARDISERKKAEKALRDSENKFRDIFETAGEGMAYTSLGGKVIDVNQRIETILDTPKQEIVGKHILTLAKNLLTLENAKKITPFLKELLKGKEIKPFEVDYKDKILEVSANYNPNTKRIIGSIRDVTERKIAEEKIKKSLEEKEILMKEIHHRVKNNMQVISSLINLQARRLKNKKALDALKSTQRRIYSMALVHERLYKSKNLARVDFSQYITQISNHLLSTYRDKMKKVKIEKEIKDASIDINRAVPLGLIINELVSNSLKHAFPDKKKGKIKISFHKKNSRYELKISDNGIGFPQELDFRKASSMGIQLVTSLVDQIKGEIELVRKPHTSFEITFHE